ncbi:YbaK family protein [Sutcliffiella deserti]|uniref:YbaK family protein n=1 Tax=Sutcliffiella deserti TaxID=2875501 RepID=UPI001CBD9FF1|nr:YbaK family protein [Sutcliffiella deserti]
MTVLTTLKEKRREKQMKYERKMLREISLDILKTKVKDFFSPYLKKNRQQIGAIEEGCLDVAIEAYLLGASYSKFGYYGESAEKVKTRCPVEEKYLIDTLYDYFLYWGSIGDSDHVHESFYVTCEAFIDYWWREGFFKGEKRYRMRLH